MPIRTIRATGFPASRRRSRKKSETIFSKHTLPFYNYNGNIIVQKRKNATVIFKRSFNRKWLDFGLHKNTEITVFPSNVEKSGNTSVFINYCQNIHVCKKYTKNVELWKVSHILSSKLYTLKISQDRGKVQLYTKLSTLSTKMCVDECDLHKEIKNKSFVYLL